MLGFLTQERFPTLWLIFHAMFGAKREKIRLSLQHFRNHRDVVEIGCSVGVVSEGFAGRPGVRYLGIDIDKGAIAMARRRFTGQPNMEFATTSLEELARQGRDFDYVLFANILHHVDDATAISLIEDAAKLVRTGGIMVLLEPDILRPDDSLLIRCLYRLERGQFRRPRDEYLRLMRAAGVEPHIVTSEDVSIDTLPGFVCGHLLLFVAKGASPSGETQSS